MSSWIKDIPRIDLLNLNMYPFIRCYLFFNANKYLFADLAFVYVTRIE